MSARLFFPAGKLHIPQADFEATPTENGGFEGSQSFLAKKSSITKGGTLSNLFSRGVPITALDENCPTVYEFLRLKLATVSDASPGIVKIQCTFTGYAQESSNSSSGEELSIPTYSLRGNLEEGTIAEHHKWKDMSDASRARLGLIMSGTSSAVFNMEDAEYGYFDENGENFTSLTSGFWAVPTGDELAFARLIAQGRVTYKKPSWTYSVRSEGSTGFTGAQLNELGKIVANPPGNPPKPSANHTWMLVGPDQEQSGEKRFIKDLQFQIIDKNDENDFLYE